MHDSPELRKLHADYAELATKPPRMLNLDETTSLEYYRVDLAWEAGTLDLDDTSTTAEWTRNMHRLEEFEQTKGFPRDNRRQQRDAFTPEHRELITWVNTNLRATALAKRCTYQRQRLALIPGYSTTSRPDLWQHNLNNFRTFVSTPSNGLPSRRSDDPAERSLANWRERQRGLYRRGTLPDVQIADLEATPMWTWMTATAQPDKFSDGVARGE
jgi:hypothetical protein